jgi:membrane-associated phospholipid phosphatase
MTAVSELAYLLCYPAVPVSFAAVWLLGTSADVDRFWLAVLAAGFACYGCLPWLVSRPPRLVEEGVVESDPIALFNVGILRRVSHQMNTFPSGHVAVSVAASLSVFRIWPAGGIVMAAIAIGIAIGAVAGRYHYLLDVIVGAVVGIIAFVVVVIS